MNDIAKIVAENPVAVLIDPKTYSDFYRHIKAETDAFVPDLSTVTSRKEIAALSYKVTRTKTAIDAAGKKLNEEARAKINVVDEQRRKIREELDALAADVRKPLTEWEQAEADRIDNAKRIIRHIEECGNGSIGGQPQPFGILFHELEEVVVIDRSFGELESVAIAAKAAALDKLNVALEAHKRAEADRVELERLRAEAAEREARETARVAAEQAARQEAEALRAEEERKRQAEADTRRREEEAAERARADEQRRAGEAIAKAEAEKRAIIEAQERAERERAAEAKRIADEQAARDADKAHRGAVMKAAKEAIMTHGSDEDTAKKVVLAIIAGEIPNVTLRF